MATLLHLSDLHLGDEDYSTFADYKVEAIAPGAKQGRSDVLASTLRALGQALSQVGVQLDAVVISGDIAFQGQPAGFDELPDMLAELGDALPDPSRILVVPGNHDVTWGEAPGSEERYKNFIDGVRGRGYVTPLLEGIDLDDEGRKKAGAPSPMITASDDSFVLVGVNSSDHCGVRARPDGQVEAAMAIVEAGTSPVARAVLDAYRSSTLYDIARVNPAQRIALNQELASLGGGGTQGPLRIGVMHHQLLPMSLEEEVKPFESVVNLAQVRDWLADNDIGVVLHGHKHVAVTYEDRYVPLSGDRSTAHRVLVSSVGTVGQGQGLSNVIGRLITVDAERPSVGKLTVRDVPSVLPGSTIRYSNLTAQHYRTRVSWSAASHLIEGAGSRQVHEQLLDLTDETSDLPRPLVCRVANPDGALKPPPSFMGLGSVPEDDEWFEDLVSLWQNRTSLTSMEFNHGERIFALNGETDQFNRAIEALASKKGSSRAVISVFNPATDNPAQGSEDFPSFCLVHLIIVEKEVRVVAYFRKQEMRYWWAVNLAELAHLQRKAVAALKASHDMELCAGEITTITAIATSGRQIPRVLVPLLDRWVDEDPARLLRMALLPYQPTMAESAAALADWETLAAECELPEVAAADGSPVPVFGLERVRGHLGDLQFSFGESALAKSLDDALELSAIYNRQYREAARSKDAGEQSRPAVLRAHARMVESIAELTRAVQTGTAPSAPSLSTQTGQEVTP